MSESNVWLVVIIDGALHTYRGSPIRVAELVGDIEPSPDQYAIFQGDKWKPRPFFRMLPSLATGDDDFWDMVHLVGHLAETGTIPSNPDQKPSAGEGHDPEEK